jgi:hypothetical protein
MTIGMVADFCLKLLKPKDNETSTLEAETKILDKYNLAFIRISFKEKAKYFF